MITYDKLNTQNHKITELSNVILYLIRDRSMCDTQVTCDLFFSYVEKVREHLEIQEKHMFTGLLADSSPDVKQVGQNFLSGSKEIKRIFNEYLNKWSRPQSHQLVIRNHEEFQKETRSMFQLVLDRIQDEVERLYPLVRELRGDMERAA